MMAKLTYKDSGVDIGKADVFVKSIKGLVAADALSKVAAFGCPFDLTSFAKKYKNPVLVSSTDGVGTKLKIAQAAGSHHNVGIDLVGMNVNDVICLGAQPLFFLDYVACGKVKPEVLKEVVQGIHAGLQQSNCALIGGETAEMPGMYAQDEYDLAGFCVGIVDKNKMITGRHIAAGDSIIGLESNGLHSNGFSLARRALGDKGIREYSKELLKPTRIYVKPISNLLLARKLMSLKAIKGIAHITGGAFYNKATKILPSGYGMVVKKKSWPVPDIFKIIAQRGDIEEKEMYSVFNMGLGMMLVVDSRSIKMVIEKLAQAKCKAWVIGEIVKSNTRMKIE
ncbi:MAG: phosphoribosylformylglycinamidine cyclo-ligase [Candidatus Omnitrophica bacterium]|nr:phosphoribosylformylglycinamidine cyclo-ligase [Candidatus Omnitrophota bacterium]